MKRILIASLFFIAVFLNSCISSYSYLDAKNAFYKPVENTNVLQKSVVNFSTDSILISNKIHQKKAVKKDIQLVSINVKNTSNDTTYFSTFDLEVFNNFEQVELLTPDFIVKKLRYNIIVRSSITALCIAGSIQYGTFTTGFLNLYSPFLYSTPFSGYYLIRSIQSNKKMKENLNALYFNNEPIPPGESIYGIIAFKASGIKKLLIRSNQ